MNEQNERGQWTSASSAQADLLCKGRHQAQNGLPERTGAPEDAWAEGGDEIHRALAKSDDSGLTAAQQGVYEACQKIEQELVTRWFGAEVAVMKAFPVREKRLWLEFNKLRHSGQSDTLYRRGSKALVCDYKTLTGDTPASPKNMQLRDLAVLTWFNVPMLTEIAVAVIQPLVTMTPELCVYNADDIKRAAAEMRQRVTESNLPNAPRTAGELQCKYCRARFSCPEYAKWSSAMVPAMNILDVPVKDWTPDQCATFCNNMGRAEKWLDECKAEMKRKLEANPASVPGWHLKPGRVKEPINNPQRVFDRFSDRGGSLEQFMATVEVAKGKLKDALRAVTKEKGKALDASMDALVEGLTSTNQEQPSLEKDKE